MAAGRYNTRMRLHTRSLTKDANTGEEVESFTASATYLWCNVDETNGRREVSYKVRLTGADATISVRQYPDLSALDRLEDVGTGQVWRLDWVRRGTNELVCDAFRWDELETP